MEARASTPTLEQHRAKSAWQAVRDVKGKKDEKEFCRQARKLPVRILTSGLGQALAFLEAKKNAPALLAAISSWANERLPSGSQGKTLLERIVAGDSEFLRRATDEVLAYLQWLVRFAEAELEGEED